MKRKCLVLLVVALLMESVGYHLSIPQSTASHLSEHTLETIEPVVDHWPQEEDNWCGAAALQAYIDYAWRFHHGDENHLYTQSSLWDIMRDFTSSHFFAKGSRGVGAALPGEVGDEGSKVRRLNIAYDFGVDPSALTWMMQYYGHDYYHYAVYRDGLYHATRWLLWTVEHYQEPIVAAVLHGSHYVLVIGYEAERSAIDPDGPGEISRVRYADPLFGPGENAYKWRPWDSIWPWVDTWEEYFTEYTAPDDPDPSTGWYVPPPDLWQGARVTVERDEHPDHVNYSPDWAVDGDTWQIMDHHDATYLPDIKANWGGWSSTITIRNNGSSDAGASVISYDSGGYGSGTSMRTTRDNSLIRGGGTWELNTSAVVDSFFGSAVVYASEDVSVVLESSSSIADTSYAGNSAPAASAYLPTLVVRSDRQAWVYLQNASPTSTNVTLRFYNRDGDLVHTRYETISANSRAAFHLNTISAVFNGFAQTSGCGSLFAETTNGTSIVASTQIDYPYAAYAYGGPSAGDMVLWTPGVFRRISGGTWQLYSAVNVQNLGSSTATIHVQFIDRSGNITYEFDQSVPAKSTVAYNTRSQGTTPSGIWNPLIAALGDSWSGSVHVTSTTGHSLVGVNLYFPAKYGSDIIATPLTGQGQSTTGVLTAPAVYRQKSGGSWTRWSAILVQNTADTQATITVRFFDSNGNQKGSDYPIAVSPRAYASLNLKAGVDLPQAALNALGTNFSGSMTVTSDGHEILGTTYVFEETTDHHAGYPLLVKP
jgi:hypothetical protein